MKFSGAGDHRFAGCKRTAFGRAYDSHHAADMCRLSSNIIKTCYENDGKKMESTLTGGLELGYLGREGTAYFMHCLKFLWIECLMFGKVHGPLTAKCFLAEQPASFTLEQPHVDPRHLQATSISMQTFGGCSTAQSACFSCLTDPHGQLRYDDDSDFIPVISGGLVATTKKWWQDSGGFDPGMRGAIL